MSVQSAPSTRRAWVGVAAIATSLFVFLTTELMPVGILSPVSSSLHVEVGVAGLMVTAYGVSAGLGVPFIVAWTRRIDRRLLLTGLLAVLALGNLATGLSPNFAVVLVTRLLMGFANGVFWAIGVNMAMRLVPAHQAGRAAAVAMSGISVATVLGMPLGMLLEHLTSWRTTFLIWSALSTVVLVAVAAVVPSLPSDNAVSVREVFRLPVANGRLRLLLVTITLFVLGQFGAFTFVRPFLEGASSGATSGVLTVMLMIYGAGGAAGNFIAGHTSRRHLRPTFLIACTMLVASLVLLLVAEPSRGGQVVLLALWGASFGAWQLCQLQMTQDAAPDTFEAAMSLNTLAYNTSIAVGALIGGLFADGAGVRSALWFGVALIGASVVSNVAIRGPRRSTTARPGSASPSPVDGLDELVAKP